VRREMTSGHGVWGRVSGGSHLDCGEHAPPRRREDPLLRCLPTRVHKCEQIRKSSIGLLPRKHAKSQHWVT